MEGLSIEVLEQIVKDLDSISLRLFACVSTHARKAVHCYCASKLRRLSYAEDSGWDDQNAHDMWNCRCIELWADIKEINEQVEKKQNQLIHQYKEIKHKKFEVRRLQDQTLKNEMMEEELSLQEDLEEQLNIFLIRGKGEEEMEQSEKEKIKLVENLAVKNKYKNDLEGTREETLSRRAEPERKKEEIRDIKIREAQLKAIWCKFDIECSETLAMCKDKRKEIYVLKKNVEKIEINLLDLERKRVAKVQEYIKARKLADKMSGVEEIKPSESKEN